MTLRDALEFLQRTLGESSISYAVIGAYAVAAWGTVRGTRDLDLLNEPRDLDALVTALDRSRERAEVRRGDDMDPVSAVVRLALGSRPHRQEVDILAGIRGVPARIVTRARPIVLDGVTVPIACPEDMIILKLRAGSARDLDDARGIVQVQGPRLERKLLDEICPDDLRPALAQLLGEFRRSR
jgi:predicted nucleotidyltransferase